MICQLVRYNYFKRHSMVSFHVLIRWQLIHSLLLKNLGRAFASAWVYNDITIAAERLNSNSTTKNSLSNANVLFCEYVTPIPLKIRVRSDRYLNKQITTFSMLRPTSFSGQSEDNSVEYTLRDINILFDCRFDCSFSSTTCARLFKLSQPFASWTLLLCYSLAVILSFKTGSFALTTT